MSLSNALLVDTGDNQALFLSSPTGKKNSAPIFFDLDIENPLGGGTLAKFRSSLWRVWYLSQKSSRNKVEPVSNMARLSGDSKI
jgi:hypothetical protein